MQELQTNDRILASALAVFAEHGYERATLSEITRRADANIAAVNYYFRSKSDLFREVINSYFGPFNAARRDAIRNCAGSLAPGEPALRVLVEAIVGPLVRLSEDADRGKAMLKLMLQMRALAREETRPIIAAAFDPVHDSVVEALQAVLPQVAREELIWRYDMARGALLITLADPGQTTRRLPTSNGATSSQILHEMLVSFIVGGFLAARPR